MTTKTIKIDNYQTNIESLESEQATIDTIVTNIYTRFNSASNANNLQYALEVLQGYRYVPNKFRLVPGRYVRYIDTTDHTNMTLRLGGFVISDNGFSVTYKNPDRFIKLNKRHCIMFVHITYSEKLRCALTDLL